MLAIALAVPQKQQGFFQSFLLFAAATLSAVA
jgi:hypothetical protein